MDEQSKPQPFEGLKEGAEASRSAWLAWLEASARVGQDMDRLMKAQLGHLAAFGREATDVLTGSLDHALTAQATVRKTAVEAAGRTARAFAS